MPGRAGQRLPRSSAKPSVLGYNTHQVHVLSELTTLIGFVMCGRSSMSTVPPVERKTSQEIPGRSTFATAHTRSKSDLWLEHGCLVEAPTLL